MEQTIEERVLVLEILFKEMVKNQQNFEERLERENGFVQKRLAKLERIVWTSAGGVIVAQAVFMTVILESIKKAM